MPPTPDWTIAELRPPTSATSRRMTPSSRLSRSWRWSRRSRLRGGRSPSIHIQGPNIGSSRRIALSMTPRLLALPGNGPLHSCTSGSSKRYDTWRYTDGPFVEDRPLAAVRRGDRGVLVYHLSHPLLARLVSLGLPGGGICTPGSLYLG